MNEEKSEVAEVKEITFLGFQILRGKIRISDKSRLKFKEKIKSLTCRNNPLSIYQIIQDLNSYLRGWKTYFQIQEFKYPLRDLDGWIRSRLRSMQLKKWKRPGKFQGTMVTAGYPIQEARRVWVKMNKWQSTRRKEVRFVMNTKWFRKLGLVFMYDYKPVISQSTGR